MKSKLAWFVLGALFASMFWFRCGPVVQLTVELGAVEA
jgi:hypothetical protein